MKSKAARAVMTAGLMAATLTLSACGEHHSDPEKKFLIDIDGQGPDDEPYIRSVLEDLFLKTGGRVIATIPTPNGKHIIVFSSNLSSILFFCQ